MKKFYYFVICFAIFSAVAFMLGVGALATVCIWEETFEYVPYMVILAGLVPFSIKIVNIYSNLLDDEIEAEAEAEASNNTITYCVEYTDTIEEAEAIAENNEVVGVEWFDDYMTITVKA